jgi:hypothetical protein
VGEVAFFSEGGEIGLDAGEEVAAVGFEVDKEDEGLGRVGIEDAVGGGIGVGGCWVPL